MKTPINEIRRMQLLAGLINESQLNEDILELKQMSKQLYSLLKKKGFYIEMVNQFQIPLASSAKSNPSSYVGSQIIVDDKNEIVTIGVSPFNIANILVGNKDRWVEDAQKRFGSEVDDWIENKEILSYVEKLGNELTQTIKSKYPNMIYSFSQNPKDYYVLNFGYGKTKKGGTLNLNQRSNAPKPSPQPQAESFNKLDEIVNKVLAKIRSKK